MSEREHNPVHEGHTREARIGVQALLSAGEHRPLVALRLPGAAQEIRLSPEEAAELAGRLLTMLHMARYDAAVFAALGQHPAAPDVHRAILETLIRARATITTAHHRADEEWST